VLPTFQPAHARDISSAPRVKFFFSDTYHRANLDVNETATICTLLLKALFALFHRSSLAGAGKKLQTEKTYQRLKILDFRCPNIFTEIEPGGTHGAALATSKRRGS